MRARHTSRAPGSARPLFDAVCDELLDPPRAQTAGRALAARLRGGERGHVVDELGDRRVLVERDDAAVADRRADGMERLERQRRVEERRRQEAGERSADEHARRALRRRGRPRAPRRSRRSGVPSSTS